MKRDISITKGMELAQLPAECVYYLLITEVLYERPAIKKEKEERKKRKTCYSRCCGDYANDKCVSSDLNRNILHSIVARVSLFFSSE